MSDALTTILLAQLASTVATVLILKTDMRWIKSVLRNHDARLNVLEGRKQSIPSTIGD